MHQSAIVSKLSASKVVCGCSDEYCEQAMDCLLCCLQSVAERSMAIADNSSEQIHICHHKGYDASVQSLALANQITNFQRTGQGCDTCPVDITGESCLSCKDGISLVSPGFMVPRITADSKHGLAELPSDAVADGDKVVGVFR